MENGYLNQLFPFVCKNFPRLYIHIRTSISMFFTTDCFNLMQKHMDLLCFAPKHGSFVAKRNKSILPIFSPLLNRPLRDGEEKKTKIRSLSTSRIDQAIIHLFRVISLIVTVFCCFLKMRWMAFVAFCDKTPHLMIIRVVEHQVRIISYDEIVSSAWG